MNITLWGFPGGSAVKNLPTVQETWIQSLDWEDPLEEEMVTHSSILAGRIPLTEEPGVHKELDTTEHALMQYHIVYTTFCLFLHL